MKAIFRNFLHVLKRFKTASVLNILGLSAALVVFTICAIQTYYDLTFNRVFNNADRLYQLSLYQDTNYGKARYLNMSYKYSDIVRLNQPIFDENSMVRVAGYLSSGIKYQKNGEEIIADVAVTSIEPQFLDIFGLDIIEGDGHSALADINKVIISEKTARRLFGGESPVGKSLLMSMPMTSLNENGQLDDFWEDVPMTIAAVYKDLPANTSFNNGIFTRMIPERYERFTPDGKSSTRSADFTTYCLLAGGHTRETVKSILSDKKLLDLLYLNPPRVEDIKDAQGEGEVEAFAKGLELIPLPNIQIDYPDAVPEKAKSWTNILSLIAIGIGTLLIAYINFMNFMIAMAPMRIRSINIQKIMGGGRVILSLSIIFEALIFTLLSFGIALLVVYFISTSSVAELFTANLSLTANIGILTVLGTVLILISLLVAFYPSYYLTSFSIITSYSGATAGRKGKQLRNTLTTVQFVAASVLILVASFIKLQHEYFRVYNWGIDKKSIVVVTNHDSKHEPFLSDAYSYMQESSTVSGVVNSTAGDFQFGSYGISGKGRMVDGELVVYSGIRVSKNFLDFFGIKVLEGEDILNDKGRDLVHAANQTMMNKYGAAIVEHDNIAGGRVAVVSDFNFRPLYQDIEPLLISLSDNPKFKKIYFKLNGKDIDQSIKHLEVIWRKFTTAPFEYHFLDEALEQEYKAEENLAVLLSIFSLITILIAIMGVYGLITFNSKYRAKEIAIRKVQGSTIKQIMLLLNKGILTQFVVAFVIAVPVAYYVVSRWLEQFAYKTPVYWWVFLLGALFVLLVTVLTVSVQSYRAATANPIGALKDE